MNWFRRVMTGRYGQMDHLNIFLFICFLVIAVIRFVISLVVRMTGGELVAGGVQYQVISIVYAVLFGLEIAVILITFLRLFSRNIAKRQQENQKFRQKLSWFSDRNSFRKKRRQANAEGKELLRCPGCKKLVRVPLGRGKIEITCPNCKGRFVRKT